MSKTDIIQRLQNLTEELKDEQEEEFFDFIENSIKNLENEKKYFKTLCNETKEKIDNLQFSKDFLKNKIGYFNRTDTGEIKKLCDKINIDHKDLKNKELFELLLKPETIKIIKDRLFKMIKKHINKIAKDYSNDEYYGKPFDTCRETIIKLLCYDFKCFYIFDMSHITSFLIDGEKPLDNDFFHEYCESNPKSWYEIPEFNKNNEAILEDDDIDISFLLPVPGIHMLSTVSSNSKKEQKIYSYIPQEK